MTLTSHVEASPRFNRWSIHSIWHDQRSGVTHSANWWGEEPQSTERSDKLQSQPNGREGGGQLRIPNAGATARDPAGWMPAPSADVPSGVANPPLPMKSLPMKRLSVLASLVAAALSAASEPQSPPAPGARGARPPPPHGGGPPRSGDRGEWRGGLSGFGRPPMRHDAFDKLPEAEKKRVREALDQVWSRPEVIEARDRALQANEELRDVIRQSLAKNDPEAAAILARVEPKDQFDPRQLPKLPPPDSAEFPQAMVQRLGMEMLLFSRPDRREETKKFHERLVAQPGIQAAIAALEQARGEARIQALQQLRKLYRDSAVKEFQALRERRAREEGGRPPEKP